MDENVTPPPDARERSRWWKPVLVALGAIAALGAAVVAWGRVAPVAQVELESSEEEMLQAVPATVDATAAQQRAPSWVRPTILWTIGLVVAVVAGVLLLGVLSQVVTWIVLALFFSFALEPAVDRLAARGWRRGYATGLLLAITLALFLVILLIFVGTVIQGAQTIAERLPGWTDQAKDWASDTFGVTLSTDSIAEGAEHAASTLGSVTPVDALLGFTSSLIGGIFSLFTVGMFLFYMVAEGPRFKRAVLAFFPKAKQEELVSIWEAAIVKTGGYFYSKTLLMVINGGLFYVVLRILGVPGAAPLALFQGFVAEFIPIVGTYIAAIVPLVISFLAIGATGTLILLIYVLIYQQVENYLLAPRLQSKTMEMHPAVAFGAALAGGAIGGLLWAFLAIPFAATVQASASIWLERHEVLESEFTQEPVVVVKERRRSQGRVRTWLRSTRGWLRRNEHVAEPEPLDATLASSTDSEPAPADPV